MLLPRSGDLLSITRSASAQFSARPIRFRVVKVQDWPTPDGWVWMDGYEVDRYGDAVERRAIFVLLRGLRYAAQQLYTPPPARPQNASNRAAEPPLRTQNSRTGSRGQDTPVTSRQRPQ